jgi:lipoprotein-anchoring transpeptidase ErfK/SrfK
MIYYIQPGDSLFLIAQRFGVPIEKIAAVNKIKNPNLIFVGQPLIIPLSYSIEINTKQRFLKLLNKGFPMRQYPVAVGKPSTPSPIGIWTTTKKALWGEQFGGYFMQLSVPWGIYGIHGTNKPWSIGKAVSHGCIRMYTGDAKQLYNTIPVGTPVLIY